MLEGNESRRVLSVIMCVGLGHVSPADRRPQARSSSAWWAALYPGIKVMPGPPWQPAPPR